VAATLNKWSDNISLLLLISTGSHYVARAIIVMPRNSLI